MEGDYGDFVSRTQCSIFQSTPSAWRETDKLRRKPKTKTFQSTPSAWRETDTLPYIIDIKNISIHSLRMEGDEHT